MLVLSRQAGQTVRIGDDIFVTIEQVLTDSGRFSICTPAAAIASIAGKVLEKRTNAATVLLTRDDRIELGSDVSVTLVDIRDDKLRVGIDCPPEYPVHRQEVYDAIKREQWRRENDI